MSTKRTCHLALVLMLGLWASGCLEDNPAYRGPAGKRDAGAGRDARADGNEDAVVGSDVPVPGSDGKLDAIPDGSPDGKMDTRLDLAADGAADLADDRPPADTGPADVRDGRPTDQKEVGAEAVLRDGPDADGSDAVDVPITEVGKDGLPALDVPAEAAVFRDGGVDGGAPCQESAVEACMTPGNPLVGACKAGVRTCSAGVWTECSDVKPVPETCNGIDDDCNGMVDEGCTAGCFLVCQNCSGVGVDASLPTVYPTIEAAIVAVGQTAGAGRSRLCVASTSCADPTVYEIAGQLRVADGMSIQGNYAVTDDHLVYCGATSQPNTTIKFTGQDQGVLFDQGIVVGAELSGFVIQRASENAGGPTPAPGSGAPAIAGVVVSGGKNVSLSRLFMTDEPTGISTAGVSITGGGRATLVGSAISGGQGRTSAVGVQVSGGSVDLRNNCDSFVGGHCATSCNEAGAVLGIRGRTGKPDQAEDTSAVLVSNGGAAASNLVGNALCGGYSNLGDGSAGARVAAVRCDGAGCASVSGNAIVGGTDQDSLGLAVSSVSPRVESNRIEGGCGSRLTTGLLLDDSSASVRNNLIVGGRCVGSGTGANQPSFHGLHIASTAGASTAPGDPDVHSNDIEPVGFASSQSACQSVGVLVDLSGQNNAGGSLRNNIIASGICNQRYAIRESNGGSLRVVENNDLYGPDGADASADPVILYRHASSDFTTASAVNSGVSGARANISVNPLYTAPDDLHLTASSACVDRGTAEGAPDTDHDLVHRPRGAGYDIGAYER